MVKRFTPPIRPNIGLARISKGTRSSQADATRQVRSSFKDVLKNFDAWAEHMQDVSPEVLRNALQPTFDESQKLVPVDTQALKNSGYLEVRKLRGRTVAEIGYGRGGYPHYAVFVHEHLESYHAAPTQAKFLEEPLRKNIDQIVNDVLKDIKEASGV